MALGYWKSMRKSMSNTLDGLNARGALKPKKNLGNGVLWISTRKYKKYFKMEKPIQVKPSKTDLRFAARTFRQCVNMRETGCDQN